jgi:hypothetical protein
MKSLLSVIFLLLFALNLSAQSKPPVNKATTKVSLDQVIGSWQLVNYQYGPQAKKRKPLTTCDTLLRWNFFQDSLTKKTYLKVVNSEECTDFGFESDWQLSGNTILIKRTKILGFGGVSASGSFLIKQVTQDQLILEFQKNKYIFRKS